MKKIIILIILILFSFTSIADAFNIKITNDYHKKLIYQIRCIRCTFQGVTANYILAGGELGAGIDKVFKHYYRKGIYEIKWYRNSAMTDNEYEETRYMIKAPAKGILYSTPMTIPVFKPGL